MVQTLTQRILEFWFGAPESPDYGARREVWFKGGDSFDDLVRQQFEADLGRVAGGGVAGLNEGWPFSKASTWITFSQISFPLIRSRQITAILEPSF